MPCNCNKGASVAAAGQKYRVIGTGDSNVDKVYPTKLDAEKALATSGKTGSVKPT